MHGQDGLDIVVADELHHQQPPQPMIGIPDRCVAGFHRGSRGTSGQRCNRQFHGVHERTSRNFTLSMHNPTHLVAFQAGLALSC